MDIFDEEVSALLKAFEEVRFRYILVGGFAVNMHGHRRATGDMDVWLEDGLDNRKALRAALRVAGYGDYEMMERMQFVPGWTEFRLNSGLKLDLMTSLKGFAPEEFSACYTRSILDDVDGIPVRYLHRNDLLHAKRAAGRNKDLGDLDFLEGRIG